MTFIRHIESITHQSSFQQENCWDQLRVLDRESQIIAPDYKAWINPLALRRLSNILRMGIATAKAVSGDNEFDAISYGTSLGCLTDTEKFLQVINTVSGDVFSPTAFIQSTHNTIAGQISLELKNHAYNMTHTQNTLSFEVALLDALLQIREGKKHVLAGAADEAIPFLERLRNEVIDSDLPFTTGATALHLVPEQTGSLAAISHCSLHYGDQDPAATVSGFLAAQKISLQPDDLILESGKQLANLHPNTMNYLPYTGYNHTASAFAVHLGTDYFNKNPLAEYVLIANYLSTKNTGITLLKKS